MSLTIRLRQMGKSNRQTFRLVVTEKLSRRDGKYIEMLGWYNPVLANEKNMFVDVPRVEYWLGKGAQLSEKARFLMNRAAPEVLKNMKAAKIEKKIEKKKKRVEAKEKKPSQTSQKKEAAPKKTETKGKVAEKKPAATKKPAAKKAPAKKSATKEKNEASES